MTSTWWFIETAPRNATEIEVMMENGEILVAHWACDLSGEEQPPFRGWFTRKTGCDYFTGIPTPALWRRIKEKGC